MDESNVVDGWTTVTLNFDAQNLNNSGGEMFEIIVAAEFMQFPGDRTGTILVDNVMLEEGSVYSGYSMVEFGNFEDYSVTWLNYHKRTFENYWKTNFNVVYEDELLGNVLKVDPSIENGEVEATQTIYKALDGQENLCPKTFIISGMAKGTQQYASGDFCVQLYVVPKNGNPKTYDLEFQSDCNIWQFASKTITLEEDEIAQIDLRIIYNNPGVAYFDNIFVTQVLKNGVINRNYYEDGRLEEQGNEEYWERYKYDVRGNLIEVVNSRYELYEYWYNNKDQLYQDQYSIEYPEEHLLGYQKKTLRASEYGYNSSGQIIRNITYAGGIPAIGTKNVTHVSSRYTYDTNPSSRTFGALVEERDNLGHLTKYFYDQTSGLLQAVINTESEYGTCYTYDLLGNITSVMQADYIATDDYDPILNGVGIAYQYNEANLLDSIITPSTTYRFTYDVFGKTETVSVGNQEIVDYDYNIKNGKLTAIHYSNGFTVQYEYDELENISKVCYIEDAQTTDAYLYYYNAYAQMQRFENLLSGKGILYQYDSYHRLIGYSEYDIAEGTQDFSAAIMYDDNSQISGAEYRFGYVLNNSADMYTGSVFYAFSYNDDGTINDCRIETEAANGTIAYRYDQLGRLSSKNYDYMDSVTGEGFSQSFQYNFTSPGYYETSAQIDYLVTQIKSGAFYTYDFTYDDDGNITKIHTEDYEYRYYYDSLGQLLREDNTALNKTYVYEYNEAGNITKKETYTLAAEGVTPTILEATYDYGYGDTNWGDKLKSYRGGAISYDEIGNPLSYYNGTRWNFTWEHGRRLATASGNGYALSFTYNDEGIRTSKTVNGVEHTYRLNGNQIVAEEWTATETNGTTVSHVLVYLYDAEGAPVGMQYRNQTYAAEVFDVYWYEKNLQGDIVAVYDNDGTPLIFYHYDAWGNIKTEHSEDWSASSTANLNPFLYRGYYYDSELGMYYLQSRYYDPAICRFINADDISNLSANGDFASYNLYVYCGNNPVSRADDGGEFSNIVIGAVVGTAVEMVSQMIVNVATGEQISKDLGKAAIKGAVGGALTAAFPGVATLISVGIDTLDSIITDAVAGENLATIATNAVMTAGFSAISSGGGDSIINQKTIGKITKSFGQMFPGNHPKVKTAASKFLKNTFKEIGNEFKENVYESALPGAACEWSKRISGIFTGYSDSYKWVGKVTTWAKGIPC